MELASRVLELLRPFGGSVAVVAVAAAVLWAVRAALGGASGRHGLPRQLATLGIVAGGLLALLLSLPIPPS
jgi:hypothetical protein